MFVKRNYSLFFPLSCDPHHSLAKIDVAHIDRHQFPDANAGRIQEFDDRAVAAAELCVDVGCFDKSHGVFHRKMVRQLALDSGRCHKLRGICLEFAVAYQELKERP